MKKIFYINFITENGLPDFPSAVSSAKITYCFRANGVTNVVFSDGSRRLSSNSLKDIKVGIGLVSIGSVTKVNGSVSSLGEVIVNSDYVVDVYERNSVTFVELSTPDFIEISFETSTSIADIYRESISAISGTGASYNYIVVDSKEDLPDAVSGVIALASGYTYLITNDIDLEGDRIAAAGAVNLFGLSSETSSLTSTGLAAETPLITSIYTVVLRSLTIKDVGTALSIDGNTHTIALDWRAVNFSNVPNVGVVNTCDNFIFETGAFLGSQGLRFTGTIGTVGINGSLFVSLAAAGNVIELDASAIITRRFRIIYSSFVVLTGSTGINVNASATISTENYILDTVNFSGAGTYLSGTAFTSEKSFFVNCIGITNTTAIANMYMKNNETATVVSVQGTKYAMAGVTEVSSINQKFAHILARNSVQYTSSVPRIFRIACSFSLTAAQNNVIAVYLGVKRGESVDPDADIISESEVYVAATGTRPDAGVVQCITALNEDDEVYLIVQNTSGTNDITVSFMNLIAERTN